MFTGAMTGDSGAVAELGLGMCVIDAAAVTLAEATDGWGIPADKFEALADKTAVAVSRAAHAHHKGSVKEFKESVSESVWALWESMGVKARDAGIEALISAARLVVAVRETRRMAIADAMYFAGLASDGDNTLAVQMRDNKARHVLAQEFVHEGPDDVDDMRLVARGVAAKILKEHVAAGGKRKRTTPDDESTYKKSRRSALLMAYTDSGVPAPTAETITDVERAFIEKGPRKAWDMHVEAEALAAAKTGRPPAVNPFAGSDTEGMSDGGGRGDGAPYANPFAGAAAMAKGAEPASVAVAPVAPVAAAPVAVAPVARAANPFHGAPNPFADGAAPTLANPFQGAPNPFANGAALNPFYGAPNPFMGSAPPPFAGAQSEASYPVVPTDAPAAGDDGDNPFANGNPFAEGIPPPVGAR